MKRLWIALAILAAVFCATLSNSFYLKHFTEELTALLAQAEAQAESGRWEEAGAYTAAAAQQWSDRGGYLHVMLRHADIDQVQTGFREVGEFIDCQEGGEYSAANARLIAQIQLICDAEQLTLENVL